MAPRNTLRRISRVVAVRPHGIVVTWDDGRSDQVDMSEAVLGLDLFAPLRDFGVFAAVEVIDWGSGIEWSHGLDYSADSLAALAEDRNRSNP